MRKTPVGALISPTTTHSAGRVLVLNNLLDFLSIVTRFAVSRKLPNKLLIKARCDILPRHVAIYCKTVFGGYNNTCSVRHINRKRNSLLRVPLVLHNSYADQVHLENFSLVEFEKVSDATLESLTEYFDELIEEAPHLKDADVSFGDGVLTIKFGDPYGTYVINRQTPNRQIWLSSPTSGPKRYDFINGQWIYKHDGKSLQELLNNEISVIVKKDIYILPTMEIMEDGNLVDRVRILLQRDMQYYQEMQTVLREALCVRVSGGKLDFPRHASFAAIKIVMWWEAEFVIAFKRPSGLSTADLKSKSSAGLGSEDGVVKKVQPSEFILMVVDTADQLLEHLHTLIQECLDHADLTVLTATLGAAALIRNCLWCYSQQVKHAVPSGSSEKINNCYKSYHEMAEAVAERLLDLHCRLISLYILNEADSLGWHSNKSFFERERCSFVIQMWWLYMQGTRADLWESVPPKMAQRVFTGMLNESLSIIVTRFIYGRPTLARSEQFWTDAFNVLCCTGYLALAGCTESEEMIGIRSNKLPTAIRDVHAKCNELLVCLLFRGTPLEDLYQAFRNGLENLRALEPRCGPSPWLLICAPRLLGTPDLDTDLKKLPQDKAVILELNILKNQPQPNWPQLMKVISMNNHAVAKILLKTLVRRCVGFTSDQKSMTTTTVTKKHGKKETSGETNCGGFLCSESACQKLSTISGSLGLYSLSYILAISVNDPEHIIIPALKEDPNWANYLDRQQVWNQSRPPWLNALLVPLKSMTPPIVETLLNAVKTGASMYQAMSLALGCFVELHVTVPTTILRTALALNDNVPARCHPLGGSVLLQIFCAALYTAFLDVSANGQTDLRSTTAMEINVDSGPFNSHDRIATSSALAEAICSIDEDNKHTTQIDYFSQVVRESVKMTDQNPRSTELESMTRIVETYTDELLFTSAGRRSLKIVHEYLLRASDWVLKRLRDGGSNAQPDLIDFPEIPLTAKPLTHIMFHIEDTDFDQFLTNYEATNWKKVLTMPLSVSVERARSQILARPEFKNVGELSQEEREVVNSIKRLCSTVRSARFK
ncbi:hypothetical protein KPH14_009131 [Odynerus spinipes]|uniref:ferroxidase n=1 Tax=Odynerus spinipes TaxID=1348599 RepID=A0AAD9RNQ6_9HYME|nr:hypothetical protein KPH14_009131 [Odynerus spinipes]